MTQTEKNYVVDRINRIVSSKKIKCECPAPSLENHLRASVARGELQLRPAKQIKDKAFSELVEKDRFRNLDLDFEDIFTEPESYRKAVKEFEAEEKKHQAKNDKLQAAADALIDAVNLNRFERGEDAIAEAHKLTV